MNYPPAPQTRISDRWSAFTDDNAYDYSNSTAISQGENEVMKLYEALALKKSLQSQLVQLIGLRNRNLEYPEDEKPEFDFDSLTVKIKEVVNKLTKIKVGIAKANMNATLPNGKTLFENIVELANLRSTVDQLKDMMHIERRGFFDRERRSKEDVKMLKQKDTLTLLSMLEDYQSRKNGLDALIQQANQSVELEISI